MAESNTDRAKREGREARLEGKPFEACPYPEPGWLCGVWRTAWLNENAELDAQAARSCP